MDKSCSLPIGCKILFSAGAHLLTSRAWELVARTPAAAGEADSLGEEGGPWLGLPFEELLRFFDVGLPPSTSRGKVKGKGEVREG